jgi:hypothetical protein
MSYLTFFETIKRWHRRHSFCFFDLKYVFVHNMQEMYFNTLLHVADFVCLSPITAITHKAKETFAWPTCCYFIFCIKMLIEKQ